MDQSRIVVGSDADDAISGTAANEEDWGLDMTGNWSDFTQKASGSTDRLRCRLVQYSQ